MAWVYLIVAGLVEVVMALSLKESNGFTKHLYTGLFIVSMIVSMGLLSLALRTLPVGTGYAVWTGIGATGTAIFGIVLLGEPRDIGRIFSIGLIVAGVIGLKFLGGE
jgi:quaternary ammonium compound-resistance protein SugE